MNSKLQQITVLSKVSLNMRFVFFTEMELASIIGNVRIILARQFGKVI
jgi:hypothetical protein